MPLRRFPCRLVIEFHLDVDPITDEDAQAYSAESGEPGSPDAEELRELVALQRRLLGALVARPDLLRRYVAAEAKVRVSEEAGQWVFDQFGYGDPGHGPTDALWEAVGDLSDEDQLAFVASSQAETLYEDAELVWHTFQCRPTDVRLEIGEAE